MYNRTTLYHLTPGCTVFNIGGNKFRLIVVIHFNRDRLYIRHVLTHAEYDRGHWREDCLCPR